MNKNRTDAALATRKYRISGQAGEYDLVTKYLDWFPEGFKSWIVWSDKAFKRFSLKFEDTVTEVTIVNADESEKITLLIYKRLLKDALGPNTSIYGDKRADNVNYFYLVSTQSDPTNKFIIPLP